MPSLSLSAVNSTTVSWSITGLSSAWNTSNYMEAILSNSPAINDSPTRPSGVLATQTPPTSGSNTFTPTQNTTGGGGFSGGASYTLYGTMRAANGNYYQAGVASVTMPAGRPSNFVWQFSTISSGALARVSATDWNNLASKVNLFRAYKGLGSFSFTSAPFSDGRLYAFMFNQMVTAIGAMSPPISVPSSRSSGDTVFASYLNGLMNSLNSIP